MRANFKWDKEIVNEGISRILIVQLWGIGETVLTLPAVSALRKKFPDAEINVLATSRNKDVFFNNKNNFLSPKDIFSCDKDNLYYTICLYRYDGFIPEKLYPFTEKISNW